MALRTRSIATNLAALANGALMALPERVTVDAKPVSTPELEADIEEALRFPAGFRAFARHWRFKNRDTGQEHTFARLWPGQDVLANLMCSFRCTACEDIHPAWQPECRRCGHASLLPVWIFALKAGKLGFTELECAWDGYVAWSRRNGRVHLFSKEENAAKQLLQWVLYGLRNLEPAWGVRFVEKEGGREIPWARVATQLLHFVVLRGEEDRDFNDTRSVEAYATSKNPAIDKVAHHAHVDEWAHMQDPQGVWSSVGTTVSPDGTAHIVTRGAGDNPAVQDQWRDAMAGLGKLKGYFADWTQRPDRDSHWLEVEAKTLRTQAAIAHFAPESWEDAFLGDEDNDFVPIEWWDACFDPSLARFIPDPGGPQEHEGQKGRWIGSLPPGDPTPLVIQLDAGVSHDNFGAVAVSRHPERHEDPAVRLSRLWRPEDFESGVIEFGNVQSWLRMLCQGGCAFGHPTHDPVWGFGRQTARLRGQTWDPGACPACERITRNLDPLIPAYNVVCISYDPHQLADMAQALKRDGVAWLYEFQQGAPRLEADSDLYTLIVNRRVGHPGDYRMREHLQAAAAKTQKDEESKLRIVKKAQHRRIDLAVCVSMGCKVVLWLNL